MGENDTLWVYDPYFFDQTVTALTGSEIPAQFTSFSGEIAWSFIASGSEAGAGWIADISCSQSDAFEVLTDTLCAGFEGFVPWIVNVPFNDTITVYAEISSDPDFMSEIIALGENAVSSDSFYLQLGAAFEEGIYFIRLSAGYDSLQVIQTIRPVYVKGLPAIPVIIGETALCTGDTIDLFIDTEIRTDYFWYLNGNQVDTEDAGLLHASEGGSYTATASNACGTVISEVFTLVQQDPPQTPILAADQLFVCPSESLQILITNPAETDLDQWYVSGNFLIADTNLIETEDAAEIFVLRENTCGIASSDTIQIIAPGLPPQLSIEAPQGTSFCENDSLIIQCDIPENYQYQWYLNDLPFSAEESFYGNQPGTYRLLLNNECGSSSAVNQIEIQMLALPQPAQLSAAGPTVLCQGEAVLLLANIQSGESIQWFINDSPFSNQSQQWSATVSGNYYLTTSTECGTVQSENVIAVTIHPLPAIPFIYLNGNPALCNGSSVELFVNPQNDVSFTWRKNNSTLSSTSNSIIVNQAGVYTISATNSCGTVQGGASVSVTSGNPPQAAAIQAGGPTTFCEGLQVTLQTTPQNGVVYTWLLNGNPLDGNNYNFPAQQAGNYTLQLSNACDTVFSTNSITVNLNPLPPALLIDPVEEQNLCLGESVLLSIPATPGVSYQWRLDGSPVGQNQPQLNTSAEGEYTLVLANTCGTTPALNTVVVNVDTLSPELPQIIAQPGPALCPGGYVLLNAPPVPFQQYIWLLDGDTIQGAVNPVLQATEWGAYAVSAGNACGTSGLSQEVILGPGDPPIDFDIYTTSGTQVCANDSIAITAQVAFGVGLRWYRDGILFREGPAQVFVNEAGTYTATAWNGCGEAVGLNQIEIGVLPVPAVPIISWQNGELLTNAAPAIQWYNSALEPIEAANGSAYTPPPVNAAFYVSSTNEFGCTVFSEAYNYIVNQVETPETFTRNLFPNPASDFVFVPVASVEPIYLTDLSGRVIRTYNRNVNQAQLLRIDLSDIPAGIYFIKQARRTAKLVISPSGR